MPTINNIAEESAVKLALEKADINELHELYKKSKRDCATVVETIEILSKHYTGEQPRAKEYISAIEAMEKVSLAAIDLAKFYIGKNQI